MNGQELVDWREGLKTDLTEVKTDVKWIRKILDEWMCGNLRLRSRYRGFGGWVRLLVFILGSVLALVSSVVFGK